MAGFLHRDSFPECTRQKMTNMSNYVKLGGVKSVKQAGGRRIRKCSTIVERVVTSHSAPAALARTTPAVAVLLRSTMSVWVATRSESEFIYKVSVEG